MDHDKVLIILHVWHTLKMMSIISSPPDSLHHQPDYHLHSPISESRDTSVLMLLFCESPNLCYRLSQKACTYQRWSAVLMVFCSTGCDYEFLFQYWVLLNKPSSYPTQRWAEAVKGTGAVTSWGCLSPALILCQAHRHMLLHPAGRSCTGCREHSRSIH